MTTFVDTSALYAVLDASDRFHEPARGAWSELVAGPEPLLTHNYVLAETFALVQARLGADAVSVLAQDVSSLLAVRWVDERLHHETVIALVAGGRPDVSLVDRVSFDVMRRGGVQRAFSFDRHFADEGFELVPGAAP